MEKGQSEVTNKIRSAIKKKLAEISDFVDDELPEYIMILVANQRSKSQIEKDLSLFLRNDTVKFTNWLWDLLNNLKVCTKPIQSSASKNESPVIKQDIDADDDAVVLGFDPDEHGTDFLSHEDTNDSFLSKSSVQPSSFHPPEINEPSISKATPKYKLIEKDKSVSKSPIKVRKRVPVHVSKEPLSSAVIPVKRKFTGSEDEYDPARPDYKRPLFSSNSRKYGGPAALQANKLLLKAVDDAAKSILHGKNIEDYYKPTPIKVLTSKRLCTNPAFCRNDSFQKKRIAVHEIIPQPELSSDEPDVVEFNTNEYAPDIHMEEDINYDDSPPRSRTICLKPVSLISDTSKLENVEYTEKKNYPYSFAAIEEVRPKSPHFIVTLDGVSRTSFKRKFAEDSVDTMEEDDDDDNDTDKEDEPSDDEVVMTPEKKLKLNERCKYWPACKNSDHCSYHHPTMACKCFPDCKFGDKCLYIHPNCKFDAHCSRKDCPFTHASKRKLPFIAAVPVKMVPVKLRRKKMVCKFYPNCTSRNCPFFHPKLCRYGTECRLPTCLFGHFPVPSRSQMKWQATVS